MFQIRTSLVITVGVVLTLVGSISIIAPQLIQAASCTRTVSPGSSIQAAVEASDANTTICVQPGTYHELVKITKPGQTLRGTDPNNKPILDGKLILPDETSGTVNNLEFNHNPLISVEAENVTIQDMIVTRSKGRAIRVYSPSRSTKNVKIIGVTMSRSRADGLAIFGPLNGAGGQSVAGTLVKDSIVEYNNAKQEPGGIGGAGLVVKGVEDVTIDGNYIRYNWGEGLLADSNWNKSTGLVIINNVVHDNKAAHVYMHAVQNVEMRNNLVYSSYRPDMNRGAVWGCIWIQGLEVESANSLRKRNLPIHGSKNIIIENNVFAGCTNSLTMGAQDPESSVENITVQHNTFVNLGHKNGTLNTDRKYFDVLVGVGGGALKNIAINYNIFVHEGSYNQANLHPSSLPNAFTFSKNLWTDRPSGGMFANDIKATKQVLSSNFAPLEANPSNLPAYYDKLRKQFMISSNSDAVNAAAGSSFTSDFFGNQRTGTPDIGAVEAGGSTETPDPTIPPTPTPEITPPPTTTPPRKAADIAPLNNTDGKVDIFDYNLLIQNFGKSGQNGFHPADIVVNGKVDIFDYNKLIEQFGK